ncbi:MAG: efflux transporter outer membrane subunit [Verrucomicrobiales bacterium]
MLRILAILIVVFFSSCAALPPKSRLEEADLAVPGGWAAIGPARQQVDTAWLRRFRDRRLDRLINEALRNNPDLRIAAARVDQAAASAKIAGAAARPQAQLSFLAQRTKRNFVGFPDFGGESSEPGPGQPSAVPGQRSARNTREPSEPRDDTVLSSLSNTFGPSLDVQWELDVWGRVRAGQSALVAQAQAAGYDLAAARTSLAAQVAKAYFALAEADELLDLSKQTLRTFQETENAVGDRFRQGQAEGQTVGAQYRLAKSDTAAARAQVQQAGEARARSLRQLELLLGRYPAGKIAARNSLPAPPGRPPAGLPSELLLRRPDILSAERSFAAQGQRIKEAHRARFPQIKLTGSIGTSTESLRDILNSDFGVWTLAGNLAQPILTGGRVQGEIRLRKAEEREALAVLQKSVLAAFGEVESALAADAYLASRENALREAVQLAVEADDEARAAFRDGVSDLLTVFAAQNRRLQTQAQLISVRRLRLDNRINLHLALGGDFEQR